MIPSGSPPPPEWDVSIGDGVTHFRWRRASDGIEAEWVGILRVTIDAAGRAESVVVPGADPVRALKIKTTAAAAFVRAMRGQPSLHGSAVVRDGAALVCLGQSGAGKSTAAAHLCTHLDFELLADDIVGFELDSGLFRVLPTESVHWLELDGHPKAPLQARRVATAAAPLAAIVALRLGDEAGDAEPRLTRLRGASAHAVLAGAAQRFEESRSLWRRELDFFASIAQIVPMYELSRAKPCAVESTAALLRAAWESGT